MRWDEGGCSGLEYDLDVFIIVAVAGFNMGAMEILRDSNIFNDKYSPGRCGHATDADYANIEAIVAHEDFHNLDWQQDHLPRVGSSFASRKV